LSDLNLSRAFIRSKDFVRSNAINRSAGSID
jgi:hypothetical protein